MTTPTPAPVPAPTWQTPVEGTGPAPGVRFAGHGARLGAYILDAILVGIVTSVLLVIVMVPLFGTLVGVAGSDGEVDFGRRRGHRRGRRLRHPRGGRDRALLAAVLPVLLGHGRCDAGHARRRDPRGERPRRKPDRLGSLAPAPRRLVGLGGRLLPRLHLDPHRQPPARLGRPDRGHLRHQHAMTDAPGTPGTPLRPGAADRRAVSAWSRSPSARTSATR